MQVESTTYILVRVWVGFTAGFPASSFDEVPDEQLRSTLEYLAAAWFQDRAIGPPDRPLADWLESRLASPPETAFELDDEARVALATRLMPGLLDADVPKWIPILAADSRERAEQIVAAIQGQVHAVTCFKLVEREALELHEWVHLEQALDHFGPQLLWDLERLRILRPHKWRFHPLKSVREKAVEAAAIIDRTLGRSPRPGAAEEGTKDDAKVVQPVKGGYLSAQDLAERHRVDPEALRKRLERWRRANLDGDYHEDADARSRHPRFIYSEEAVMHLIEAMKGASGKSSGNRPPPGNLDA